MRKGWPSLGKTVNLHFTTKPQSLISKSYIDEITYAVNGAAIEVHRNLGPGLLESIYHRAFEIELKLRNISFSSEYSIPVSYKETSLCLNLRCDLLIEDIIVVELKSVAEFHPIHNAQLLTYMRLLDKPKGILYNYNVQNLFYDGQRTLVNEAYEALPDH
ncbi:MAG: GxxExxY protein [Saprospiraceae bacterium]|nr:GxxExxY protein [Saprospiraceae bacterium]